MTSTSAFWITCGNESGRSGANYGDELTRFLLDRLYGVDVTHQSSSTASLVSVGSTLQFIPESFSGTIIGTGYISAQCSGRYPHADVKAVRGALTAERCGVTVPLGDPGLLVRDTALAEEDLGEVVIPHYIDTSLREQYPNHFYIDVLSEPQDFINKVAGASLVVTSSLHALITADALGIPRVLVPCEKVVGGMFKFEDYASSIKTDVTPNKVVEADSNRVDACISRLRDCFSEFVDNLLN